MRKTTKKVVCGGVAIGGGAPLSIQSMTNTDTADAVKTLEQIARLKSAGCEIVRMSVYNEDCARAVREIKDKAGLALVADIHFDYKLAILAMENGIDKVRFNPGNIGEDKNVRLLVDCAKRHSVPIRVGVNAASLEKDILDKCGDGSEALVMSALRHVELLEKCGFYEIVISVKSSSVPVMIDAYRLLSQKTDYPLHIGVTEAGTREASIVKSSIGLGALLSEGIGDTLRVSITGDPVDEVYAAKNILRALKYRHDGIDIVSCPTCGRCKQNLEAIVEKVREELKDEPGEADIAIMGCAVNGPGEARGADMGIAFGGDNAVIFKKGEIVQSGTMPEIVDAFIARVRETLRK